ncbi:MAG: chloride channel protein [Legionellales bacterium]|nr:chloride channel protein [Legionellales bacterium]
MKAFSKVLGLLRHSVVCWCSSSAAWWPGLDGGALGSPLGREVAPRELSALIASKLTAFANLSPIDTRIMFACGAGAGLAAVYNVPLSGAVYVLEVLLCTWSPSALFPALATSFIAVVISWIGLGNVPQYHLPHFSINLSLAIWAILAGPLFGLSAYWFKKIADLSHQHMPHHWKLPVFCLLNFILIGVLAIAFPELLGNGKSPAQLAFDARLGIGLAAIIFILHTLTVWSSLWAGAQGGLLTPSLANGALLAMVFGGLWNEVAPPSELGAYALIGATVFLAEAQSMPITALILLFEFTHPSFEVLIPTILAIVGSVGLGKIIRAHRAKDH